MYICTCTVISRDMYLCPCFELFSHVYYTLYLWWGGPFLWCDLWFNPSSSFLSVLHLCGAKHMFSHVQVCMYKLHVQLCLYKYACTIVLVHVQVCMYNCACTCTSMHVQLCMYKYACTIVHVQVCICSNWRGTDCIWSKHVSHTANYMYMYNCACTCTSMHVQLCMYKYACTIVHVQVCICSNWRGTDCIWSKHVSHTANYMYNNYVHVDYTVRVHVVQGRISIV